jgi:hypothetical protein
MSMWCTQWYTRFCCVRNNCITHLGLTALHLVFRLIFNILLAKIAVKSVWTQHPVCCSTHSNLYVGFTRPFLGLAGWSETGPLWIGYTDNFSKQLRLDISCQCQLVTYIIQCTAAVWRRDCSNMRTPYNALLPVGISGQYAGQFIACL